MKNSTNTATETKNLFKGLEFMGFCGFYYSIFDSDNVYDILRSEQDYYMSQFDIEGEIDKDIKFDYEEYQKAVADAWAARYADGLSDIVKGISNVQIMSPKFYNFETDKIISDVELVDNWKDILRDFMNNNYDALKNRIHDDWSDRDGFWSFIDNDIDNWPLFLFSEDHFDSEYLEIMLMYYLESKEDDAIQKIDYNVSENIDPFMFIELSDEFLEKVMYPESNILK